MPTRTWTNFAADLDWANPANWAEGSVPAAGDDVLLTGVAAPQLWTSPATTALNSLDSSASTDPAGFDSAGNQISAYLSIQPGGYLTLQSPGSGISDNWFGDASAAAVSTLNGLSVNANLIGLATLNDFSQNAHNATIAGNATLNANSRNYGNITGDVTAFDNADCEGYIDGNGAFYADSQFGYSTGTASYMQGNATFNDSSACFGTVAAAATFNDESSASNSYFVGAILWLSTGQFDGGTLLLPTIPATSDVRTGVAYGYNDSLTGTAAANAAAHSSRAIARDRRTF